MVNQSTGQSSKCRTSKLPESALDGWSQGLKVIADHRYLSRSDSQGLEPTVGLPSSLQVHPHGQARLKSTRAFALLPPGKTSCVQINKDRRANFSVEALDFLLG